MSALYVMRYLANPTPVLACYTSAKALWSALTKAIYDTVEPIHRVRGAYGQMGL